MENTTRRSLLIFVALATIGLGGCASVHRSGPDKVVYHLDDSRNARAMLRNVANHLSVEPTARIVVVGLANGVDFLMEDAEDKNGNPYNITVEELTAKGVIFDVCEITLKARDLGKDKFIPEAKFVSSGVAEIAKLQYREGYAYVKP
jgi:intracellular sulfur oxidation DsrE/DsrF family protein